jgi:hypothetical protein
VLDGGEGNGWGACRILNRERGVACRLILKMEVLIMCFPRN